jgi:hypothetical protein
MSVAPSRQWGLQVHEFFRMSAFVITRAGFASVTHNAMVVVGLPDFHVLDLKLTPMQTGVKKYAALQYATSTPKACS